MFYISFCRLVAHVEESNNGEGSEIVSETKNTDDDGIISDFFQFFCSKIIETINLGMLPHMVN